MQRSLLVLFCILLSGCINSRSAVDEESYSNGSAIPETRLRTLSDLRAGEDDLESKPVTLETNFISRDAIPLGQPEGFLRNDPMLTGVPLVILYFPAEEDGRVRKLQYEWGDQEGKPNWVQQPLDRLATFQERYETLRLRLTQAYGEPVESAASNASSAGDIKTWRRGDKWVDGDTEATLALSFSEPVPDGGNRGNEFVRYNEVHRIRLTITHGL